MLFFIKPVKVLERILIKILIFWQVKALSAEVLVPGSCQSKESFPISIFSEIGKKNQLVWLQTIMMIIVSCTRWRIPFQYNMKHYQLFFHSFFTAFSFSSLQERKYFTWMKLIPSLQQNQNFNTIQASSPLNKLSPFY